MKQLHYRLEAWLLSFFFRGLRVLPLDVASAIGGMIGRSVGPFFSAHHTAKKNIAATFPEMSTADIDRLVSRMWDHLGRVGAEYPFLPGGRMTRRLEVVGAENLPTEHHPCMFFSGHIGNWELLCHTAHTHGHNPLSIVYRRTNNPYVDTIIANLRKNHVHELIAKGLRGGIKILAALKRGSTVAMLIDQKQNNGIAVPLFGREAMTSPAIAEIALKYNFPVIPARIIRIKGAHFKAIIYPPLPLPRSGDHKRDVLALMTMMHQTLEGWIREYPEQWFWVHRRWPKEPVTPQPDVLTRPSAN